MSVKFSNNAKTTLSSAVTSSATSITVADGSVFPSISGSEYFYVTLEDASANIEIVKVTAVSGNTLTVVRAQDGTSARTFSNDDKCELRLTAAGLNDVATQADTDTTYTAGSGLSLTGTEFANTAPDQTVALTGTGATSVTGTYPNFTITSTDTNTDTDTTYTAGTGLSLTGTEFANTAPDQTVALTGAGATTISGTYPNFTITSTDTTYSVGDGGLTEINFTSADNTKLDGIATNATNQATQLNEEATITYGSSRLQWADVSGQGGTGADGSSIQNPTLDWYHHIVANHANNDGYYYQLTMPFNQDELFFRRNVGGSLQDFRKVWHDGNDGSGSGLDADTVDGVQAIQLYRRTGSSAATAGAGWVTVASNVNGRKHGEVIVSDSDSGDHSFIRIDWLRSYQDSSFTVINCGGHGDRITAVRVLEQTSDVTYGTKYLQVYVTTSSSYSVRINTVADVGGYSSHTVVTPVTQNAITGYQTHSDANLLVDNNIASSKGIASGTGVFQSTAEDAELKYYYNGSSLSGLKCSINGVQTTVLGGRLRFGSSTASFIQNGPGSTVNLSICANGGSTFFYGGTNAATHLATIGSQSQFNCGYGSVQNAYMVRAWGRFEMSGTHSWRDDEGFSSITDIATGRTRINFTSTMPNAYYSVNVTTGSTSYTAAVCSASVYSLATTLFYVSVEDLDGGFTDRDQMNVMVVR